MLGRFQSTRPRGARRGISRHSATTAYFNPRARVGRDPPAYLHPYDLCHFNPRARVGRDSMLRNFLLCFTNFNPRARVGRDDIPPRARQRCMDFNPRARVGRDHNANTFLADLEISIHAPAWGATPVERRKRKGKRISIHAPAWGATVPVYTGLITAVALYFSRTSFLAMLLQAFFVAKSSV